MISENIDLWKKIESFQLDDPNASFPFSQKLAKQNNWTETFASKAIAEYKKFIYLCCISPTGASPSSIVDEVWHLHLTYTKSYWEDFCNKTLGLQVHHHPSKGGTTENHKHTEWYNETLLLYENVFKQKPPPEIWQQNNVAVKEDAISWSGLLNMNNCFAVSTIFISPFLLCALVSSSSNPYHLTGQHFLGFYLVVIVAAMAALFFALFQRQKQLALFVEDVYPTKYNIYQAIHFLYGKHTVLQTAIVDLLKKDLLQLNDDRTFTNKLSQYNKPFPINPLIVGLSKQEAPSTLDYEAMFGEMLDNESLQHPSFDKLAKHSKQNNHWLFILLIPAFMIGILRVLQGLQNNRPVAYLIMEMGLLLLVFVLIKNRYTDKEMVNGVVKKKLDQASLSSLGLQQYDAILLDFSKKGANAISGFSEFPVLASIFAVYSPVAWGSRSGYVDSGSSSTCSSGSSCGGSSCSSGCGGCGGGD